MDEDDGVWRFPRGMAPLDAHAILAEAYSSIPEGKLLRRLNRRLRKDGIDPPMHVQYTAEPHVEETADGLEVHLHADILIYEEFPELEDCVDAFEDELWSLLEPKLEKAVKRWTKHRPSRG